MEGNCKKKNIITNIIIIITIIVKKYFLKKILVWAPSVWLDAQPLRLGTLGAQAVRLGSGVGHVRLLALQVAATQHQGWPRPQHADTQHGACHALGGKADPRAWLHPQCKRVCSLVTLGSAYPRGRVCNPALLASGPAL